MKIRKEKWIKLAMEKKRNYTTRKKKKFESKKYQTDRCRNIAQRNHAQKDPKTDTIRNIKQNLPKKRWKKMIANHKASIHQEIPDTRNERGRISSFV